MGGNIKNFLVTAVSEKLWNKQSREYYTVLGISLFGKHFGMCFIGKLFVELIFSDNCSANERGYRQKYFETKNCSTILKIATTSNCKEDARCFQKLS